jgi:3-methyladenine DNA glycosylase AlkD
MNATVSNLYKSILSDILVVADKKHAEKDKHNHKYEGHKSYGLSAPILDKVLKKYRKEIKTLTFAEALDLATRLTRSKTEEETLAANFVLQIHLTSFTEKELSFLDKHANNLVSWSTTDDFCIDVVQPILLRYPRSVLQLLKKWNKEKHVWKRRASVVAFVRKVGESGKFTKEVISLTNNLVKSKEDLVLKGVGWALKDNLRGNRPVMMKHILSLRQKGVSPVVISYALGDLTAKERKRFA